MINGLLLGSKQPKASTYEKLGMMKVGIIRSITAEWMKYCGARTDGGDRLTVSDRGR